MLGTKQKERTHESRGWDGSQLSPDQHKKKAPESRERRAVGCVPGRPRPKQKERAHESRERRGWESQLSRNQNKKKKT